jgi:hypothetical protein
MIVSSLMYYSYVGHISIRGTNYVCLFIGESRTTIYRGHCDPNMILYISLVKSNTYTITNWRVSLSNICHEWPNNAVTHECIICPSSMLVDDLIFGIEHHFQQYFSFITCECDSSAPFFVIYKAGREPTPYWW